MIIDAPALAVAMRTRLTEMREREAGIVLAGISDFPKYRESIGFLRSTEQMLTWLDTVVRSDGTKLKG